MGGIFFDINFDYPYLSGAVIMFVGFLMSLLWVFQGAKEATDLELRSAVE